MRIDDENKIVWCSEGLFNWKESFGDDASEQAEQLYKVLRVGWGYSLDDSQGNKLRPTDWLVGELEECKLRLAKALINDYTFEVQEPKYYWRKKKEHIFNFEKIYETYLNIDLSNNDVFISNVDEGCSEYKTKFTKQEARELLKDDFNKFEKVECE